ncbi:hypothetical protein EDB81DRAFT_933094 [Dactylonectria macrodidyma]|uniref:Uncharacterized protein n=1 Tax=Dactylonectria macrodidyma TaxID=307937 RepID=A0A9P9J5A0_9HYPO|nr:hypothetical protein EDB81DRAFT_933094 [Dactylonectria macrodidyma]
MSSSSMNKYWIPHLDIHKKVITQELQYYLGPEATVRPYTLEGEDGFLITTPGSCLTDVSVLSPSVIIPRWVDNGALVLRNKLTIYAGSPKSFGIDKQRRGFNRIPKDP